MNMLIYAVALLPKHTSPSHPHVPLPISKVTGTLPFAFCTAGPAPSLWPTSAFVQRKTWLLDGYMPTDAVISFPFLADCILRNFFVCLLEIFNLFHFFAQPCTNSKKQIGTWGHQESIM